VIKCQHASVNLIQFCCCLLIEPATHALWACARTAHSFSLTLFNNCFRRMGVLRPLTDFTDCDGYPDCHARPPTDAYGFSDCSQIEVIRSEWVGPSKGS